MRYILVLAFLLSAFSAHAQRISNFSSNDSVDKMLCIGMQYLEVEANVDIFDSRPMYKGNSFLQNMIGEVEFVLFVNPTFPDIELIIAHEVIHIKQYHQGKLKELSKGVVLWNGKKYHLNQTPYDKRPWEIEAIQQQYKLARYIKSSL